LLHSCPGINILVRFKEHGFIFLYTVVIYINKANCKKKNAEWSFSLCWRGNLSLFGKVALLSENMRARQKYNNNGMVIAGL